MNRARIQKRRARDICVEKTAKELKLMFETTVGEDSKGYLRPETAQLIFTNF